MPRQKVEDALPRLQQLAEDARRRTGIPGLAIAVVYMDEIIYLEGLGVREAGKPEAVDPDTVFQLASLSKPIAATVVAALVGDGVVAWDDPIIRHDPGFEMYDPWVTRQVTLRDMFAHRSGLPDHAGDLLEDIGYDRAEILYRLRYQKPGSSFRSHYAYTNFGLTEAAVAAAMASGKSWEDVSAELLYQPLGMKHTSSRFADFATSANRARGHVQVAGQWVAKYARNADAQSPAGGASSSARDMAMWLRLQLAGGRFRGKQIIAAAALDETHRPQIVRTPPKNPAIDHAGFYGLGWNIDYDAGGLVHWSHSGGFDLGAATCVIGAAGPAARHRRADQCPADRRAGGAEPQLSRSGPDRQGRAGLADALRSADGGGARAQLTAPPSTMRRPRRNHRRHCPPPPMSVPTKTLSTVRSRSPRAIKGWVEARSGPAALPDAAFRPRRVHLSADRRERRRPERRHLHDRRRSKSGGGDHRESRHRRPGQVRPGARGK